MGFPRQEYWNGLPFPSPGDLPDPGIESTCPASPALQVGSLPLHPLGNCVWPRGPLSPTSPVNISSLGFPGGSAGKESACNAGDLGSVPGLGRSRGEGNGYPLQYSGLENSMDCIFHGVAKSQTQLSDLIFYVKMHTCRQRHTHISSRNKIVYFYLYPPMHVIMEKNL